MATPMGHAIVGALVARRLGVESPRGLAASAIAACLPDADFLVGKALHGDYWRLHRGASHSLGLGIALGLVAGFSGLITDARGQAGERDLVADAVTGAAVIGSHAAVDRVWLPYRGTGRRSMPFSRRARREAFNMLLDAAVYGLLARLLWPRSSSSAAPVKFGTKRTTSSD